MLRTGWTPRWRNTGGSETSSDGRVVERRAEHVVFVKAVTLVQQVTRRWSRRKSVRGGCAHIWVTRIPLTQHWPWPTVLITTITLPDLTPRTFRGGRLEHFYFRSYKWKDRRHFIRRTVVEHLGWRALRRDLVGFGIIHLEETLLLTESLVICHRNYFLSYDNISEVSISSSIVVFS